MWGGLLGLALMGQAWANEARIEGMRASWRVQGEELVIELEAATTGWMVVGFNDRDAIVGADLKFVRVVDGVATLHDHHVVGPGDHRDDTLHGGSVEGRILEYAQADGRTRARVSLPLAPTDRHDRPLRSAGWMILAWSVSPDLDHHSRVRRHLSLTLGETAQTVGVRPNSTSSR